MQGCYLSMLMDSLLTPIPFESTCIYDMENAREENHHKEEKTMEMG